MFHFLVGEWIRAARTLYYQNRVGQGLNQSDSGAVDSPETEADVACCSESRFIAWNLDHDVV